MDTESAAALHHVRHLLQDAAHIAMLTGAGVSAESGVPTFRDAQTGLWARFRAEDLATEEAFRRDPERVWDWYAERRVNMRDVRPNAGHVAVARFQQRHPGRLTVITQNVDGLHQKAGSQEVLELHGSVLRNHCTRCGKFYGVERIAESRGIPRCTCGGIIKPDVVLYEESLDEDVMARAIHYIRQADVLIIGGTSLVVYPAAGLIQYYRGHKLAVINKGGAGSGLGAAVTIDGPIGQVMAQL